MLYAKISRPNSAGIEFLRIPMYNGNSFIYIFNNCYKQKERQLMQQYIRSELLDRFEFQNYGHALEILSEAFPEEWNDIQDCLTQLHIKISLRQVETKRPYRKNLMMFCILEVGVR